MGLMLTRWGSRRLADMASPTCPALPGEAHMFEVRKNRNGRRMIFSPTNFAELSKRADSLSPVHRQAWDDNRWGLSKRPCIVFLRSSRAKQLPLLPQEEGERSSSQPPSAAKIKQPNDQRSKRGNNWSSSMQIQEKGCFGTTRPSWVSRE